MSIEDYAQSSTRILNRRDLVIDELQFRGFEIILSDELEDSQVYDGMMTAP